jgi:cytochrome c-type biogenesis protein CcmH
MSGATAPPSALRRLSSGSVVIAVAVLAGLLTLVAVAVAGSRPSQTTAEQAHAIASTVRCPVCKDLSAADSPAPLAGQMRRQITEFLEQGRTPDQIRAHFVRAYGDSVLMSPPRRGVGQVAYLLPLLVVAAAGGAGGLLLRRWRRSPAPADRPPEPTASSEPEVSRPRPPRGRRGRRIGIGLAAGLAVAVGVATLLTQSVTTRTPAQTVSGDQVRTAAGAAGPAPAALPGADQPTAEQVAAVDAAVARVRRERRSADAHLELARAYAAAGQSQLSTIEYLAVTRLDDTNAEANTALAMLAFLARQPQEAKKLADKALAARPHYPEALYTRGLIQLMGLKQPVAAEQDLADYLDAAPFGSHRATVETLLAMIPDRSTE